MSATAAPFLTAEWRHLAMVNYEVDPAILRPFVPAGTELDEWQGQTFVSVVGFMFLDTRVLGMLGISSQIVFTMRAGVRVSTS